MQVLSYERKTTIFEIRQLTPQLQASVFGQSVFIGGQSFAVILLLTYLHFRRQYLDRVCLLEDRVSL